MSMNSFGHLFRITTWGESHGPALGATVDGCPPGVAIDAAMIQHWLDKRKPGQNKFTTQRREPDEVEILSGVFDGVSTGTPIQLMIKNTDQRSKDYGDIAETFRPGHADITYWQKYGIRDYRGGGRSSARETAARVAAGGVAREAIKSLCPDVQITGYMTQIGTKTIDRNNFDWHEIENNALNGIIIDPFSFPFNVILTSELYLFFSLFKLVLKGSLNSFIFNFFSDFFDLFANFSVSLTERDFSKIFS